MACSRCSAQLLTVVGVRVPPLAPVSRHLSTTCTLLGKRKKESPYLKWGLEKFPRDDRSRRVTPFTDLPDYTFLDGRPTPLYKWQLARKEKNYQLAKRIVMLAKEVEDAKAAHVKRFQDEAARRENIISSKLKPKSEET